MNTRFLFLLLVISMNCYSQNKTNSTDRMILGKEYAERELEKSLSDTIVHNVVDMKKLLIKEEKAAIQIAEVILFSIYSEKNIIQQRPYETYFIDTYWVVKGTLPKLEGIRGGTFLIIIDARDGKILRITHGR